MSGGSSSRERRYRAVVDGRSIDLELGRPPGQPEGAVNGRAADLRTATFRETPEAEPRCRTYSTAELGEGRLSLIIDGRSFEAVVRSGPAGGLVVYVNGREFDVDLKDEKQMLIERFGLAPSTREGIREVRAPMPGLVLSVEVEAGAAIVPGQGLLVLEAMKMENELRAETNGVIKAVHVAPGEAVVKNALLVEIQD